MANEQLKYNSNNNNIFKYLELKNDRILFLLAKVSEIPAPMGDFNYKYDTKNVGCGSIDAPLFLSNQVHIWTAIFTAVLCNFSINVIHT